MTRGKLQSKPKETNFAQASSAKESLVEPALASRGWPVAALVFALSALAFSPILTNGFVGLDDRDNIVTNLEFRGLGWRQVAWAATTYHQGVYQPLGWLFISVQHALCGLDARGYHLVSLLVHATNAVVLFYLVRTLVALCRPDLWRAAPARLSWSAGIAVALFAVHPMRTEAVAWVSCQSYLPSILFYMLSVSVYLRACGTGGDPSRGALAVSFALFVVALLFKAVAVSAPAVLLIIDVYPLGRLGSGPGRWFGPRVRHVWREKVPFFMVSLIFTVLAIRAKAYDAALVPLEQFSIEARIAQALYGACFYLGNSLLPFGITAFYPAPPGVALTKLPYAACALAVVCASAACWSLRRRCPGLLAVWAAYLVILAPNSGVVRIGAVIAANRYCYAALMGWVVLLAAGLCWLLRPGPRQTKRAMALAAAIIAALAGLIGLTWRQCRVWHDPESLWVHVLDHGGGRSAGVHLGLGLALFERGKLDEAQAQYSEALRLRPDFPQAHNNLALLLAQVNRIDDAVAHFRTALRLKPGYAEARNNLGVALLYQGQIEEAVAQFTAALELKPDDSKTHYNLGSALLRLGRFAEAEAQFASAIQLRPDYPAAHRGLERARLEREESSRTR